MLQQENKAAPHPVLILHDPLDLFKEYQDVDAPLQEICAQFGPLLHVFIPSLRLFLPIHRKSI